MNIQEWIFESSRPGLVITIDGKKCSFLQFGSDSRWLWKTDDSELALTVLDAKIQGVELISGNGFNKKIAKIDLSPAELSMLES